jgi:hypothetical protein
LTRARLRIRDAEPPLDDDLEISREGAQVGED